MKYQKTDFVLSPVPDSETIGGYKIAVVLFGIGITLPVFYVGSQISTALGFKSAVLVFILACFIVGSMMMATSILAARTRLSTYMILHFSFGSIGAKFINSIFSLTYIGYFAATGDIFGSAIHDALISFYGWDVSKIICAAIGSIAMALTAMFGFKLVEKFSKLAVPLLAIFLMYLVFLSMQRMDLSEIIFLPVTGEIDFGVAVSMVIGANILMAAGAPDFARFAKNDKEAIKTVSGVAIGYPLIMLASGLPSLVTGETDIMKIMINLDIAVPALLILIFATWTTNTVNLYSGILTLSTIFSRTKTLTIGLVSGLIGTIGASLGVMEIFLPFVFFLGIATSPVAGVYLADFFIISKGERNYKDIEFVPLFGIQAYISWIIGSGIAFLTSYTTYEITTIPALDGLIVSFLMFVLGFKINFIKKTRFF